MDIGEYEETIEEWPEEILPFPEPIPEPEPIPA